MFVSAVEIIHLCERLSTSEPMEKLAKKNWSGDYAHMVQTLDRGELNG